MYIHGTDAGHGPIAEAIASDRTSLIGGGTVQPRVTPFENLLPYLSDRVVTSGEAPEGGHYARLDNDLYFHTYTVPNKLALPSSLDIQFLLFFNPDGSHSTPPIEILVKLLTIHLGYHFTDPGGILGDPSVRGALHRVGEEFGMGAPSLTRWWVKEAHPLPPGAPRHWSQLGFLVAPHRHKGPQGFDWSNLGPRTLQIMDSVLGLLEMTRPMGDSRPLEPR